MKHVLIAGGSGLVGSALSKTLENKGYAVSWLSTQKNLQAEYNICYWNPSKNEIDEEAIKQADVIINLAGAGVAEKRWTKERKMEILRSRIDSTRLLIEKTKELNPTLDVFIGASAIGYYGYENNGLLTEQSPAGKDFLAGVCQAWEKEYNLQNTSFRKVVFRIGIVLSKEGGALGEMTKTLPFFVGVLGSGTQIYSWIHIDDLVNMFVYAIENKQMQGIYNGVAPNPVSQKNDCKRNSRFKKVYYNAYANICFASSFRRNE
ncbi:MAG: TIGR01777 family oxidoreductase [Chitinophagales bacterium]|nr:TIGR01777 family oxidoreductase [Chitinophagales bacterium]